jgi:hypothetical protein
MRKSFVFLFLVACGGAKAKPEVPAEEPAPDAGADAATAAVDAAPAPTAPIACRVAGATCTEYRDVPGDRAQELRDQCTKAGGEALDACPSEKVAATCTVSKPPMTVVSSLYRAKDAKKTRTTVASARRSCEANGGTFTAAKR